MDRDIDFNREELEPTDIDNESAHNSNATVALTEPDETGHTKDPMYSNHDKLMTLMREIDDLHQQI